MTSEVVAGGPACVGRGRGSNMRILVSLGGLLLVLLAWVLWVVLDAGRPIGLRAEDWRRIDAVHVRPRHGVAAALGLEFRNDAVEGKRLQLFSECMQGLVLDMDRVYLRVWGAPTPSLAVLEVEFSSGEVVEIAVASSQVSSEHWEAPLSGAAKKLLWDSLGLVTTSGDS